MVPYLFPEHSLVFSQPTPPPTPDVVKEQGRMIGLTWLIFTSICSIIIAIFYTTIFVVLGVPTENILSAYCGLVILHLLVLIALAIGIHCMLKKVVLSKILALSYNIYLTLIMILAIAIMVLFSHDVPVAELTSFLSNNHAGARTFLHYLETKLNCCGLMSNYSQSYYEYGTNGQVNNTNEYVLAKCPEKRNKPGCLDNISNLSDVLKHHEDIKNIFLLQEFLPIFTILEIVVLLLLFNMYIKEFKDEWSNDSYEGESRSESNRENVEGRPTTARTHVFYECPRSLGSSRSPSFSNARLSIISDIYPGLGHSDDEGGEGDGW